MTSPNLVTVGTYLTVSDADLARMFLESEGIDAFISDAAIVAMDWMLGNAVGWVKVQVAAADVDRAKELLSAWQRPEPPVADPAAEREDRIGCLSCGAAMGLGVTTCPACGWSYLGSGESA